MTDKASTGAKSPHDRSKAEDRVIEAMPEARKVKADAPLATQRSAQGLIAFYEAIFYERGMRVPPHLRPVCPGLMDDRIQKFLLIIGPGSGKSSLLSVAYPAKRIGDDPTQTIIGISGGEALMQGFLHSVMNIVEWSPEYRRLYPKVRPDKLAGWSNERGLVATGHPADDPDPNYWCCGIDSQALTGKHARTIICDDLHNKENSATIEQCDKIIASYYNTIIGRADPKGCKFIIAGRRWHENDIYGHLKESGEWVVIELPAEREGSRELWVDVTIPDGLTCCYNDGSLGG